LFSAVHFPHSLVSTWLMQHHKDFFEIEVSQFSKFAQTVAAWLYDWDAVVEQGLKVWWTWSVHASGYGFVIIQHFLESMSERSCASLCLWTFLYLLGKWLRLFSLELCGFVWFSWHVCVFVSMTWTWSSHRIKGWASWLGMHFLSWFTVKVVQYQCLTTSKILLIGKNSVCAQLTLQRFMSWCLTHWFRKAVERG
jgi:hypothetical protein